MKKIASAIVIIAVLIAAVIAGVRESGTRAEATDYIRIHIRANSDSASDQKIKYEVRDSIVCYLTPLLANCKNAEDAKDAIKKYRREIEKTALLTLQAKDCGYGAKAYLTREEFPARTYDGFTLAAGEYDALIIDLGGGEGENWWCVAFPPLCFVPQDGDENVEYKSKILEIINKYKEKKKNG